MEKQSEWIEMIHLRSYNQMDREKAEAVFQRMDPAFLEMEDRDISLYRNHPLEMDLSVFIQWKSPRHHAGKSNIALLLASVLSEYGLIFHTVWKKEKFRAGSGVKTNEN